MLTPHSPSRKSSQSTGWIQVLSHTDSRFGGIASSVPELSKATESQGGPLCPIASFSDDTESSSPSGVPLVTRFSPDRTRWMWDPRLKGDFKRLVRRSEGVHIHGVWEPHCMVTAAVARACRKPYVISAHGMLEQWALGQKRLKKALYAALFEARNLQRAACLRALTSQEVKDYRRVGLRAPIAVVPSGVEVPPNISKEDFLNAYPQLRNKRLVLFLGRLHHKKGLSMLLQAWAGSLALQDDFHLVIAGPDSERTLPLLQSQVTELHLDASVTFAGMLRGSMKWSVLRAAEVFVLPSFSEGFSISVLEALGTGVPVIVTHQCNFPEIQEFECGWVIQPRIEELQSALGELATMPPSRVSALGERGKELAERKFSWPVVGKQMAEVYAWLQGGPRPESIVLN